jgi:aldose 1-epimerase
MKKIIGHLALSGVLFFLVNCSRTSIETASDPMSSVSTDPWGQTSDGRAVSLHTLKNSSGLTAKITDFGALLVELHAPDRKGLLEDIVLGFDRLEPYFENPAYFGCTTGRVANRIGGGKFSLNGQAYQLATNLNGKHHLHGGDVGLDKRLWNGSANIVDGSPSATFTYTSPDGEEGYPGNLSIQVTYLLTEDNHLRIEYRATSDRSTPVNLTNHSYFNLAGAGEGTVLNHELLLMATSYTEVDSDLIPTGKISMVEKTPLDFRKSTPIGDRIHQLPPRPKFRDPGGYDHNMILTRRNGDLSLAARVYEPVSGRILEVFTTEPGVQLYTGNFLDGTIIGKNGVAYKKHFGFCLETQHYPDSVNRPEFPSTILEPDEIYTTTTTFKFSTD